MRRLACPSVMEPMQTGDGLLARIPPPERSISPATWREMARASARHGNGQLEVTARGSLQVRGLTEASSARFAADLQEAGLELPGAPVIHASPLRGRDPQEEVDVTPAVRELRAAFEGALDSGALHPKLSVVLDGGGALSLDALYADVRLRARPGSRGQRLDVSVAGTAEDGAPLGCIGSRHAASVATALLAAIAREGRRARARSVLEERGADGLRSEIEPWLVDVPPTADRGRVPAAEVLGGHALRGGRLAVGLEPAFGACHVDAFDALLDLAEERGVEALVPVPGRAFLLVGIPSSKRREVQCRAQGLGFVTDPTDPRRSLVACSGAPSCASAALQTRALAPDIARAADALLDGSLRIHLSGCPKGCAHPRAAALTLVAHPDGFGVVIGGDAAGAAEGRILEVHLPEALARLARSVRADASRASAADHLNRCGAEGVRALLLERADA